MVLEIVLFAISIAAVISSLDFIAKSVSNMTHSMGIPEYLASTIILSFVISLPVFVILFVANVYNVSTIGISALLGFSIATITLVMGVFLLKNEVNVEYEGYRNATFMWASALLFLVVSVDRLIDRGDAIFLISLFVFYSAYMYYRTKKSKEYVFLKTLSTNKILIVPAFVALILSSFATVATISIISSNYVFSAAIFSLTLMGFFLVIPLFDVIKSIFKSPKLTLDNLIGNLVVTLCLVPGVIALILPIPYDVSYRIGLMPLLFLNVICLVFAMITRFTKAIGKKTGILLIAAYLVFVGLLFYIQ